MYFGNLTCREAQYASHGTVQVSYVVENDQWPIDAANRVVSDARVDRGHAGVFRLVASHDEGVTMKLREDRLVSVLSVKQPDLV